MGKGIRKPAGTREREAVSLSELIHQHVRVAIETAVHEELRAALGTSPYERSEVRRGYRNGIRERALTGPTGPVALALPRATLFRGAGVKEWTSTIVPRYQRRMPEVNAAVVATYLPGGNTRRIRGALQPLLKAAPLSKSAVSRVIATLKDGLVGVANTLAHRPRRDLRLPRWLRSASAQRREGGQRTGAGCGRCPLRRAQTPARSGAVRRGVVCGVERLPRRSRGAWPASSGALHYRREPRTAPRRRRDVATRRCTTLLRPPASQSRAQGSLPSEDAALILLFSLVASGQIKLRRIDGWRRIAAVLSQHTSVAA